MSSTKTDDALVIGAKFKTSAVGLVAVGKATYGEWEVSLSVVAGISRSCQWWLGDLLNLGHSTFGEKYSQAVDELGFDPGYLRNLSYVCEHVQLSRRRDDLSFSQHQEVASCDPEEQDRWLGLASANKWTRAQLREAIQEGEHGEDSGEPVEDEELSTLVHELEDYLEQLEDNQERIAALKTILRKCKSLAKQYGGAAA